MLWVKKVLRIAAAMAVAFTAAYTAEREKGQTDQQPLIVAALQMNAAGVTTTVSSTSGTVPKSASLNDAQHATLGNLVGITAVAGTAPVAGGNYCSPSMDLTAMPGAMILLSMYAPCNRNERIVIRHSGLSFAAKTAPDGAVRILLPAMKADALVAVYLSDARLVLGRVAVPDVTGYSRYAVMWEWPAEIELRVTDGEKVMVGSPAGLSQDLQQVMSLGSDDVQSPVMASVYSVQGATLGSATVTGELRITPASCGRTLRVDTVTSAAGGTAAKTRDVAVPLCGTAGDILLLKNLAPDLTLSPPK